jgi:hypothetical protein
MLAGHDDCIFNARVAGACPLALKLKPAATATVAAKPMLRTVMATSPGWPYDLR